VLLAVRCGAHLSSKPSAVKRLGRCNDVVGATCILQGLILYCFKQKGGQCSALCCVQCVRCAHLNSEPLAEQRLACCSNKAGGNPQTAGSIIILI
jgi:hypothetical protein